MSSAFYSIIQFVPDPDRQEGVNVGVMLLEPSTRQFNFILTRPIRRIQCLFRQMSVVDIVPAHVRFYNRVMAEQFDCLDDLTDFCLKPKGLLRCTEPLYVPMNSQAFSTVLNDLLHRLVL